MAVAMELLAAIISGLPSALIILLGIALAALAVGVGVSVGLVAMMTKHSSDDEITPKG